LTPTWPQLAGELEALAATLALPVQEPQHETAVTP
jgi:hypothetical protein